MSARPSWRSCFASLTTPDTARVTEEATASAAMASGPDEPMQAAETPEERMARYAPGVRAMYTIHFILAFEAFIIAPTLYLYLLQLEPGGSRAFQGTILAAFFITKMLSAPLAGYLSDKVNIKAVFAASIVIMSVGNFMYAMATSKWWLFAARVVAGVGGGIDGVTLGYVAQAMPRDRLSLGMANLRGAFGFGQIVAPGVSALIALGKHTFDNSHVGPLKINIFTIPSLASVLLCIVYLIVEVPRIAQLERNDGGGSGGGGRMGSGASVEKNTGCRLAWLATVCLIAGAGIVFGASVWGTVLVPLVHNQFGWGALETSLASVAQGVVALVAVQVVKRLITVQKAHGWDDRKLFLVFGGIYVPGTLLLTSYLNPTANHSDGEIAMWQLVSGWAVNAFTLSLALTYVRVVYRNIRVNVSNFYMSIYSSIANVARIVGPLFGGFAHPAGEQGNGDWAMLGGGGAAALGWLLFLCSFTALKRVEPPPDDDTSSAGSDGADDEAGDGEEGSGGRRADAGSDDGDDGGDGMEHYDESRVAAGGAARGGGRAVQFGASAPAPALTTSLLQRDWFEDRPRYRSGGLRSHRRDDDDDMLRMMSTDHTADMVMGMFGATDTGVSASDLMPSLQAMRRRERASGYGTGRSNTMSAVPRGSASAGGGMQMRMYSDTGTGSVVPTGELRDVAGHAYGDT